MAEGSPSSVAVYQRVIDRPRQHGTVGACQDIARTVGDDRSPVGVVALKRIVLDHRTVTPEQSQQLSRTGTHT